MTVILSKIIKFSDLPADYDRLGLVVLKTNIYTDLHTAKLKVEVIYAPVTANGEPVVIAGKGVA